MKVQKALQNLQEKKLDQMRENIVQSLSEKAAIKLEEMKVGLATNYFGTK